MLGRDLPTTGNMNVGIGTVAAQFLFLEYTCMFRIFGIVSLRCDWTLDRLYSRGGQSATMFL